MRERKRPRRDLGGTLRGHDQSRGWLQWPTPLLYLKRCPSAPPSLSDASGMRVSSVPAAMARALVRIGNALGAEFRPGGQAKAVRRSPPSVVRRPGRSLGPFRSTVWIATPASPRQGWGSLKGWAASMAPHPLCRECKGTGWIPYSSETLDDKLEEAY